MNFEHPFPLSESFVIWLLPHVIGCAVSQVAPAVGSGAKTLLIEYYTKKLDFLCLPQPNLSQHSPSFFGTVTTWNPSPQIWSSPEEHLSARHAIVLFRQIHLVHSSSCHSSPDRWPKSSQTSQSLGITQVLFRRTYIEKQHVKNDRHNFRQLISMSNYSKGVSPLY